MMFNIQLTGSPPAELKILTQIKTTLDFYRLSLLIPKKGKFIGNWKSHVTTCIINRSHNCLALSIIGFSSEPIDFGGYFANSKMFDRGCYQKINKTIQTIYRKVNDNQLHLRRKIISMGAGADSGFEDRGAH